MRARRARQVGPAAEREAMGAGRAARSSPPAVADRPLNPQGQGDRLIVEPMPRPSLLELLSTWDPLDEEFPEIDDLQPIEDVRL